jgi:hypothetical protein
VAMTAPQAALYDAAVQQFRADAANASGPQPGKDHILRVCNLHAEAAADLHRTFAV